MKLKSDYAALISIVNKLSTAPAINNLNFWNSLRREKVDEGNTWLYYISTSYIVGGIGTVYTASGVEYYLPSLNYSSITIDPTFSFITLPLFSGSSGYRVCLLGASSPDTTE